jgi:cytochrome P450
MANTLVTDRDVLRRWGGFGGGDGDDPYPVYARVREEAPVRPVVLADGRPAWIITGYDEARQALLDPRLVKSVEEVLAVRPDLLPSGLAHPLFGYHMLAADGADHTRLRRLVGDTFTTTRMAVLRDRVQDIVDELLDRLEEAANTDPGAAVDLVAGFALPLPITVIFELLGIPLADRGRLRGWLAAIVANPTPPASDPPARAAADETYRYLTALLSRKRSAPGDDLLSVLAIEIAGDRRAEAEVLSTAWLLMVAGHETTVNLIGNGLVALLRHPDQLARLRSDLSLVPRAVEEFLRFDGPVQHATFRMTSEAVTIGGVDIPAHEQVLVVVAAANRDPVRFPEPDRFDVGRAGARHVAFGHGIHFCLGAPLARLEGDVAFASLLRRFPRLRPAVPPDQVHWTYRLTLRSLVELPVFLR